MTDHTKTQYEIQTNSHLRVMPLTDKQAEQMSNAVKHVLTEWDDGFRYITCDDCKNNKICAYSFDPYNTDGDCLGLK